MIDISQYRIRIGAFLCVIRSNFKTLCSEMFFWNFLFLNFLFRILVMRNLISTCGDIETNPGPDSYQQPSFCHVNMRSITANGDTSQGTTKFIEFEAFISSHNFAIIGVTETWLDNSIDSSHISLKNYLPPVRRDRTRHGGGVCVYIRDDFPAQRITALEVNNVEVICVEYFVKNDKRLLCFVYKAPDVDILEFLAEIDNILTKCDTYNEIILMGDFNCKNQLFCSTDKTTADGKILKAFFDTKEFAQLVHDPTRFQNGNSSCLDLVFTNRPLHISDTMVHSQINNCDHCPVSVTLSANIATYSAYKRMVWDYKRGDYDKLRGILQNTRWDSVFTKSNVHDMSSEFMSIFEQICEACIPHYEATIRPRNKPYITTEIKKLIRHRDRLLKTYRTNNTPISKVKYSQARNKVVSKIRQSLRDMEEKQLHVLTHRTTSDAKSYWQALRTKFSAKPKPIIPPLLHNNVLVNDPVCKAELFNDFFVSQTRLNESSTSLPLHHAPSNTYIDDIHITEYDTFKILMNLETSKATGPDGIGNKLLRETAPVICEPLSKLFQKSIDQGIFPNMWKVANITVLHKKGSVYDCNNYRPISLLPCVSKVFEKLVFNHMYDYLTRNNLINANQSGFRPGDSTIRQLTSICHKIHQSLDNGDEILSVFLDFKKAFDKVWHKGLLYKLEKIGIHGSLLEWLKKYLSDRRQCVVIQGRKSTYRRIYAGVPQGSVLGPLLFLIYINDICKEMKSLVQLYADDTSLFRVIKNKNIISAVNDINDDLSVIQRWSRQWLVEVSTAKSVAMIISKKNIPSFTMPIFFGNVTLEYVSCHKHLGLWIDSKMSWSNHIDHICTAASKRLNMMTPLKYKLPRIALETIYTSFVRPVLEYADVIFDNCSAFLKNQLEIVQIHAAQIITGAKRYTSHTSLYKETGWTKLCERRRIHKLVLFHQIVHKTAPAYLIEILPSTQNTRTTRQTNKQFIQQFQCKTETFRQSFFPSTITSWNILEDDTRQNVNRTAFRRSICKQFSAPSLSEIERFSHHTGSRPIQICMAQMRVGFSNLNADLFSKNCIDSPTCRCGQATETIQHFFFECVLFVPQRTILRTSISDMPFVINLSPETFLYGIPSENLANNLELLYSVQLYIKDTKRFN